MTSGLIHPTAAAEWDLLPLQNSSSRRSEQTKDLNRLAVFENNVEETQRKAQNTNAAISMEGGSVRVKNKMPLIPPPYKTSLFKLLHGFCSQIHIASFLGVIEQLGFVITALRPVASDAWSDKPVGEPQ